ncbi:MAG: hypothetical protein H6654_16585 [Ardenticatenaceae bacterium]|nr:hypothetical protein [Anaerolineales bacterium]MCB8939738.1 hypothetical protein [Ardenticatenaceae bacterium]MCB8975178.1 hypothetical protein [Ardenticatenaceae bacterium]
MESNFTPGEQEIGRRDGQGGFGWRFFAGLVGNLGQIEARAGGICGLVGGGGVDGEGEYGRYPQNKQYKANDGGNLARH